MINVIAHAKVMHATSYSTHVMAHADANACKLSTRVTAEGSP